MGVWVLVRRALEAVGGVLFGTEEVESIEDEAVYLPGHVRIEMAWTELGMIAERQGGSVSGQDVADVAAEWIMDPSEEEPLRCLLFSLLERSGR